MNSTPKQQRTQAGHGHLISRMALRSISGYCTYRGVSQRFLDVVVFMETSLFA